MRALLLAACGIGAVACGGGYGGSGYGAPVSGAPSHGTAGATLSVLNFLSWCSIAIDGDAASTDATVTAAVIPGGRVTIVATPASSSFEIGPNPWFGVDENGGGAAPGNDLGSGLAETSTAVVTINQAGAPQCVSVCCQEHGNGPIPCPATNQCP